VVRSFRDADTQTFWETGKSKGMPPASLRRVALRKLLMLDSAGTLNDLRVPPGNRLEELKGDRKGQHSIRINDQFRICFIWRNGNAYEVEITDYH
jgi:proteic killer suppression protein